MKAIFTTIGGHLKSHILMSVSFALLVIIGISTNDSFATLYNIQNLLRYVAIIGTLSIGVTTVFLMKEMDLSIGSLLALNIILAVYITSWVYGQFGAVVIGPSKYILTGMYPVIILTILTGTAIGFLSGLITTTARISSLITTLGIMYAARGLSYILTNGQAVHFSKMPSFQWLGSENVLNLPANFLLFLLLGTGMAFLIRYTVVGRRIRAIGGNPDAARLSGINVRRWIIGAMAFSGFCSGLAAFMYSSYMASADPGQGVGYEFAAIATAVFGGTTLEGGKGSIFGTMFSACVIGLLNNIMELNGVNIFYQNLILGLIIIAAVAPAYMKPRNPGAETAYEK